MKYKFHIEGKRYFALTPVFFFWHDTGQTIEEGRPASKSPH